MNKTVGAVISALVIIFCIVIALFCTVRIPAGYVGVFQFPQLRVRYIAKITKAHCISAAQFVQLSIFASFIIEEV